MKIVAKLFLLLILLASCGGGTVGTGGDNSIALSRVEGVVTTREELPISGVSVSIDGVSEVSVTKSDGSFSIDIDNTEAFDLDSNTEQVILVIRVRANIDGQDELFETVVSVRVDASETLADVRVSIDVPDGLIDLIQMLDDSQRDELIESLL